jgi:hypothetical protein
MEHYCDHLVRPDSLTPSSAAHLAKHAAASSARPFYSLAVRSEMRNLANTWLTNRQLADKSLILIQAGKKRTMKKFDSRQRATNTKYLPDVA